MNLADYKEAEESAYNRYMYYEAAERSYDAKGADAAKANWYAQEKLRKEAEEVGNCNVLASLIELVNYHREPGNVPLEVLLIKAQEAIRFMTGTGAWEAYRAYLADPASRPDGMSDSEWNSYCPSFDEWKRGRVA